MFTPQAPVGSPPMGLPLGTQLFTPDAAQRHVQEQPQQSELPPEVDFDRSINYLLCRLQWLRPLENDLARTYA